MSPVTCTFHVASPVAHSRRRSTTSAARLPRWPTPAGPRLRPTASSTSSRPTPAVSTTPAPAPPSESLSASPGRQRGPGLHFRPPRDVGRHVGLHHVPHQRPAVPQQQLARQLAGARFDSCQCTRLKIVWRWCIIRSKI